MLDHLRNPIKLFRRFLLRHRIHYILQRCCLGLTSLEILQFSHEDSSAKSTYLPAASSVSLSVISLLSVIQFPSWPIVVWKFYNFPLSPWSPFYTLFRSVQKIICLLDKTKIFPLPLTLLHLQTHYSQWHNTSEPRTV